MSTASKTANSLVTFALAAAAAVLPADKVEAYQTGWGSVPANGKMCNFSYDLDNPRSEFRTTFTDCCDVYETKRAQVTFKDGTTGIAKVSRSAALCNVSGGSGGGHDPDKPGEQGHEGNVSDTPADGPSQGL